jgi:flagellar hook-associated protein 3 FlgL
MERNLLYNLTSSEERLQKLQDMATSGMKFQKPEDDPVGVQRSMRLRNERVRNEQYIRNLGRAKSWMEYGEKALSELTGTLGRASELGLAGVTGTTPQDARDAIAAEVRQLQEEVESLKSRTMEGRTILTGTMPTWKVGDNLTMTTEDLTALLDEAIGYLSDLDEGLRGVGGQDVKVALTNLDMTADKTLAQRATNGARVARIETLETKLVDLDIEYKSLLSDVEDVDITEVIVKLKSAEAAFQAALGAGAKLIQPSLLDYLK